MSNQIDVIVTAEVPMSAEEKVRGAFPSARNASRITHVSLEAAIVEAGLREMIDKLGDVFLAPPAATRNFEVDEIELSLAIDAKGSVWCCQSNANRSPHDALRSLTVAA
jgi:hypothetical protein